MSGKDEGSRERKLIADRLLERLWPLCETSVVPLLGPLDKGTCQHGTGTLFRVGDAHFVVTAAHVVEKIRKPNFALHISDVADHASLLRLPDQAFVSDRVFDVAFFRLDEDHVKGIPGRRFLDLTDVQLKHVPGEHDVYHVFGYPSILASIDKDSTVLDAKSLLYTTGPRAAPEHHSFENYDPQYHILLEALRNGNVPLIGDGDQLPPLPGVSGCAIWWAPAADPFEPKIIAIETGTYRDGTLVKGTYWGAIVEMLGREYPDLRRPIRLHTDWRWHRG